MKVFKRILKYTFAILIISVLFQSLAIIVIHYSEKKTAVNSTSKSFRNTSIVKYNEYSEVERSCSGFINTTQEKAVNKISRKKMVLTPEQTDIRNVILKKEKKRITEKTAFQIDQILKAATKAKQDKETQNDIATKIESVIKSSKNITHKKISDIETTKKKKTASSIKAENLLAKKEVNVPMNLLASAKPVKFLPITKKEKKPEVKKEKFENYKVRRGDSLIKISKKFNMKLADLKRINNLNSSLIRVGQKLKVRFDYRSKSKSGNTFSEKTNIASLSSFSRNSKVTTFKSSKKVAKKKKKSSLAKIIKKSNSKKKIFNWPVTGRISSRYGRRIHPIRKVWDMHSGIDIAARRGKAIKAANSGRVIKAGWMGGYGKIVIIKHKSGYETRYAHCSKLLVKKGQYVSKGKTIAKIGTTGSSTGPHLHFEVRKYGKTKNPVSYLK